MSVTEDVLVTVYRLTAGDPVREVSLREICAAAALDRAEVESAVVALELEGLLAVGTPYGDTQVRLTERGFLRCQSATPHR